MELESQSPMETGGILGKYSERLLDITQSRDSDGFYSKMILDFIFQLNEANE